MEACYACHTHAGWNQSTTSCSNWSSTAQVRPLDCHDPFINMKTSLLPAPFQSVEACFGFALCRATRSSTTCLGCLGCNEQNTAKKGSAEPNKKMLKRKLIRTNQNSVGLTWPLAMPENSAQKKSCIGKSGVSSFLQSWQSQAMCINFWNLPTHRAATWSNLQQQRKLADGLAIQHSHPSLETIWPASTQTSSCRFTTVPPAPHLDGVAFYRRPQQLVNQPLSLIDRWKSHGLDTPVTCSRPTANQPRVQTLSSRRLRKKEATQSRAKPWFEVDIQALQLAPDSWFPVPKTWNIHVLPSFFGLTRITILPTVRHPIHPKPLSGNSLLEKQSWSKRLRNAGNDRNQRAKVDHRGMTRAIYR